DFYFVSREAAEALMARVKLGQGKNEEAATLAEALIASPTFKLDSFDKVFRGAANSEVIFAFKNLTAESSINMSTLFYTYAHPQSGSYVYKPNPGAMTMFEAGDLRTDISVDTYEGLDVVNKYPSGQQGTDPIIITRLAEMYLVSAEAQGLAGIGRLNELRAARGLDPVSASSDEEYLDLVLEERRRELFAEGFRWVDLVRTGKAKEVLGIQDREVLMPIPETELLLNERLEPNDGY
ncbi:MAG: RagB/SusD family nutrient uptake outer membrane protein, partial [Bacteroidota bacterium]|nr:RagB/SusD family nutrient uptake outer membrane protein [Bacteroidota bacterium]